MKRLFWGLLFFSFLQSVCALGAPEVLKTILSGKDLRTGSFVNIKIKSQKAFVLIFLSTECPNSQAHIAEIKKLAEKYPDFLFAAVHANANESLEGARLYFQRLKLPFTVLQDEHGVLADRFKALKTPQAYVVSPEGGILYQGGVTDSAKPETAKEFFLQNALEDIKKGESVKVAEGRVLGCVISRSKESTDVW